MEYLKKSYEINKNAYKQDKMNNKPNNSLVNSISLYKNSENLKKIKIRINNKNIIKRKFFSKEISNKKLTPSFKKEKKKILNKNIFKTYDEEIKSLAKRNTNSYSNIKLKKNFPKFKEYTKNIKYSPYLLNKYKTDKKIMLNNNCYNSMKNCTVREFKYDEENGIIKGSLNNYIKYINIKKNKLNYNKRINLGIRYNENKNYKISKNSYEQKMIETNNTTISRSIYSNTDKNLYNIIENKKLKKVNQNSKIKNNFENRNKVIKNLNDTQLSCRPELIDNPFNNTTIDLSINNSNNRNCLNENNVIRKKTKHIAIRPKDFCLNKKKLIFNKVLLNNLNIRPKEKNVEDCKSKIDGNVQRTFLNKINTYKSNFNANIKYFSNKENNNRNNKSNKNLNKATIFKTKLSFKKNKIINNKNHKISTLFYKKISSLSTQDLFKRHNISLKKSKSNKSNSKTLKIDNNKSRQKEEELISKKISLNASISKKGLNYHFLEEKRNQDSLFKVKFSDINYSFYGICDGYGNYGNLISEYIAKNLPIIFYMKLKTIIKSNKLHNNINNINYPELFQEAFSCIKSNLFNHFNNKNINIDFSGSNCVSLLFSKYSIISASIGESTAIKGRFINNKWTYKKLTRDNKPLEKGETERNIKFNREMHLQKKKDIAFYGYEGELIKEKEFPRLAMTRVVGYKNDKSIGSCFEPEIKIFPYEKYDKFVIIASDGLWQFVSNEEIIEIVGYYYKLNDCDSSVVKLYEIAYNRWIKNNTYIYDISIIVVFLE